MRACAELLASSKQAPSRMHHTADFVCRQQRLLTETLIDTLADENGGSTRNVRGYAELDSLPRCAHSPQHETAWGETMPAPGTPAPQPSRALQMHMQSTCAADS